jgi:hypothetical protein
MVSTGGDSEVISDIFNIAVTCTSGNYAQKQFIK